ncbi:MAG TPA: DUF2203 domain-containing protein [Candidatus Binatia bacterium]|nr:DUF2203 domain-containing protein [Candidatus Binatia bacterium]
MVSSVSFPRLFTVDEANALLPTVRALTERIQENIRRLRNKSRKIVRHEKLDPEATDFMERLQEDSEIARLVAELKDWVEQIYSYGCICKGVDQGLIDFPCMLGAEVVFLCWQLGEATVSHWHRIEDGFAGRRPLLDVEKTGPDGKTSYH